MADVWYEMPEGYKMAAEEDSSLARVCEARGGKKTSAPTTAESRKSDEASRRATKDTSLGSAIIAEADERRAAEAENKK